jgi:hypothetical protein
LRKLFIGLMVTVASVLSFTVVTSGAMATPAPTVVTATSSDHKVQGKVVNSLDGSVKNYANGKLVASPKVASTTSTYYWYNGRKFWSRVMCADNRIGLYWNIPQANDAFESGYNTVVIQNQNVAYGEDTCHFWGYDENEIMRFWVYNSADGACSYVSYHTTDGVYDQAPNVYLNQHYASCVDTLQHRNNTVSNAAGSALGLAQFSSSTNLTGAVMNQYFRNSYNFAGADDRNALYNLY